MKRGENYLESWRSPRSFNIVLLIFLFGGTHVIFGEPGHSRNSNKKCFTFDERCSISPSKIYNHRPIFRNCANYSPVIRENELSGAFVIQVEAYDEDPPNSGGTVSYSFGLVPGSKDFDFEINATTGVIRVNGTSNINKRMPDRMIQLAVVGMDNGDPQLFDICVFKVTFQDVMVSPPGHFEKMSRIQSLNHKPQFWKCSTYSAELKENVPIGTVVIYVRAFDEDLSAEGGTISYSLEEVPGKEINFEVNDTTGEIKTSGTLSTAESEGDKMVYLTVLATDNGQPQMFDNCTFKVTILKVSNNIPLSDEPMYQDQSVNRKPKFWNCSSYRPVINENNPLGSFVVQVKAHDEDPPEDGGKIRYSINQTPGEVLKFKINDATGVITTRDSYSRDDMIYLSVLATDNGIPQSFDSCTFKVTIQKDPDVFEVLSQPMPLKMTYNHPPHISNCSTHSPVIKEDAPPGTVLTQVEAYDEDPPEYGGRITYSLVMIPANKIDFQINDTTGVIKTNSTYKRGDAEGEDVAFLTVMVTDNGDPLLFDTCTLKITILESNYNSLMADEPISLKLQQERRQNNRPIFVNCSSYSPEISEVEPKGTFVIQVKAYDEDPPEDGGTISYSLSQADGETIKFEIYEKTGVIRTTNKFGLTELNDEEKVRLIVNATDNGEPQLSDVCNFTVTIQNAAHGINVFDELAHTVTYNLQPTFWNCSTYLPVIRRDAPPGSFVIQVKAYDDDPPEDGGTISYSLNTMNGEKIKFKIDETTGIIRTTETFNTEESELEKVAYLSVQAIDNGTPEFLDYCLVKVVIEDVDDIASGLAHNSERVSNIVMICLMTILACLGTLIIFLLFKLVQKRKAEELNNVLRVQL